MKQADIWFHMEMVGLILYADLRPLGISIECEKQLSMILRSWILSKE
jgi:hypothetical protein